MSPTKRKAIVFDLKVDQKNKSPRIKRRTKPSQFAAQFQDEEPADDWIPFTQPEVLSMGLMMQLLTQNYLRSADLAGKSRKEVEKLFLQHVSPKPQRQYNAASRLGQTLMAQQKKLGGYETPEWHKSVSQDSPRKRSKSSHIPGPGSSSSLIPSPVSDRLKPPPLQSCIDTSKKTVKLCTKSSPSKDSTSPKNGRPALSNSSIDKIDILLKPSKKLLMDDTSTNKVVINEKRKLVLNKSADEQSDNKKLKPDDVDSKVQPSPSKHASVAWP